MRPSFLGVILLSFISLPLRAGMTDPRQEQVRASLRACSALTQEDDVRSKRLSQNIQTELGDTCIVQKPSVDSVKLLNSQIKNAFQTMDTSAVWEEVQAIALDRSVRSLWTTYQRYIRDERLDEKKSLKMACEFIPRICKTSEGSKKIQEAFKTFQKDQGQRPVEFLTGPVQAKALSSVIQPLITRINGTCESSRSAYQAIKSKYNCLPIMDLKSGKMSQSFSRLECDDRLAMAQKEHRKLYQIVKESIDLDRALMLRTSVGPLMVTGPLRQKMGVITPDYTFETCMKGEGEIFKQITNQDLITARKDFYVLAAEELKQIEKTKMTDLSENQKHVTLKQYLKTNPATVAEMLKKNPEPDKAYAMCALIKSIQSDEYKESVAYGALTAGGIIAGLVLGGGTPMGVYLSLGMLNLFLVKNSADYIYQVDQVDHLRGALATKQKELDDGIALLDTSDALKSGSLHALRDTLALEVLGFGIGSGIKYFRQLQHERNLNALLDLSPTLKGLKREELIISKLNAGAKRVEDSIAVAGSKANHFSQLNDVQKAKLSGIYSNLTASQANHLTRELSSLKSSKDIDAFLMKVEKDLEQLRASNFDPKKLSLMVTSVKLSPEGQITVAMSPKTSELYGKAAPREQQRMNMLGENYRNKLKLSEEEMVLRMNKLQNCFVNGVLKKGCLQTTLTKLERDLSDKLLLDYMDATQKVLLSKADKLNKKLQSSDRPIVYDAVFVGAGPHNSIALAAFREANPKLKVLVIEATEDLGVFDALKGFNVNTGEYLKKSGNTFPASAVQLKDFNIHKKVFTTAEDLGDQTLGAYLVSDSDMIFNTRVTKWTEEPTAGAWPAPHRIETNTGLTIYTRGDILGTGFGNPLFRLKDEGSLAILAKYQNELKSINLVQNINYSPRVVSVDDLVSIVADDAAAARTPMGRCSAPIGERKNVVLIVGAGDGGNIGVEACANLSEQLNPRGLPAQVKTIWLGQPAKTAKEFLATLTKKKLPRYGKIAKGYENGSIEAHDGYLSKVEEFVDASGKTRFRVHYTFKDGSLGPAPLEVDNIVFATGYPNDPSTVSPLFDSMAKNGGSSTGVVTYDNVLGRVDDYTPYDQFKGQGNISRQVMINGKGKNVFLVGNVAKVDVKDADWEVPVGGLIDINGPRSAATGKMLAQKITQDLSMTHTHTVVKSQPQVLTEFKVGSKSNQPSLLHADEVIANVDMKIQLNRSLREFKAAPQSEFSIHFLEVSGGEYKIRIKGIDKDGAAKMSQALAQNADLMKDLKSMSYFGKSSNEVKLLTRSDGLIRFEKLEIICSGP